MKSVDYYFDFGSPAAYLAWTQLPKLTQETGAQVVLKPMLLGGVFQATGNHSPATVPAKGAYIFKDFARYAKAYGVVLNTNPHFPINTLTLMRIAMGLQSKGDKRFTSYCNAMYQAIWVDAQNMNDPATVAQVWAKAGFDPAELMAIGNDAAVKEELKTATSKAVERGVFGAPTFFVGDKMYWGQDRLDFVKRALELAK